MAETKTEDMSFMLSCTELRCSFEKKCSGKLF